MGKLTGSAMSEVEDDKVLGQRSVIPPRLSTRGETESASLLIVSKL